MLLESRPYFSILILIGTQSIVNDAPCRIDYNVTRESASESAYQALIAKPVPVQEGSL